MSPCDGLIDGTPYVDCEDDFTTFARWLLRVLCVSFAVIGASVTLAALAWWVVR